MSYGWLLFVLGVLVVVGIVLGFGLALLIAKLTGEAAFAFGQGAGMLLVTFGSCTVGVMVMYFIWSRIEGRLRAKAKAERAKEKKTRDSRRKRRRKK
jgi:uncharacterized membrane protein